MKTRNNEWVDHLGNTFKSLDDMAKFHGFTYSTLYSRLVVRKWDAEKAFTTPMRKFGGRREYTLNGVTYPNLRKVADAMGVSESFLRTRVSAGESLDDVYEEHQKSLLKAPNGKVYKHISDVAFDYGVNAGTLRTYVRKYKMPLEDAILRAKMSARQPFFLGGIEFTSIAEAARHYNIPIGTFYTRINRGCSELELLEPVGRLYTDGVDYKGSHYKSIMELSSKLGVPYHRVLYRVYRGMEIGKAVDFLLGESA